ncbi:transcription initiation factor TFIID subunit 9B [Acrasis kona]|uniref:Transcription initiation factor TFIID subunit 9B n=1 Tax=Acrasis kona TaxID=1008807 RepID=A0AAW2Z0F9_9EUKA
MSDGINSSLGPQQSGGVGSKANEEDSMPRDADVMEKILESMGIKEFEPRVVEQFLELMHRYVNEVLNDALLYQDHSGRDELELEDIRLAIQSKVNYNYTSPPSVEYLLELANHRNTNTFLIPEKPRVLLPPAHHCLAAENYQLDVKSRKRQKLSDEDLAPLEPTEVGDAMVQEDAPPPPQEQENNLMNLDE